jgi:hypothetical protein
MQLFKTYFQNGTCIDNSLINYESALYNFYATSEVDEASLHKA